MPTVRHRYMITETDDLIAAIDAAATLWPHAKGERAELLRLIIKRGAQGVEHDAQKLRNDWLTVITQISEDLGDVWPNDWSKQRTQEWPA